MKFSGVQSPFWNIRINFRLIIVLVLVLVLKSKNKEEDGERERTHPLAVFVFPVHIVLRRPPTEHLEQTIPFFNLETV